MYRLSIYVLCAFILAIMSAPIPVDAQNQQLDPEMLKGEWAGEWTVREMRNKLYLIIKDVTADGKVAGTVHIGNTSRTAPSYHNVDLPVAGTYSSDGKVTLQEPNTRYDLRFRPPDSLYGNAQGARASAAVELIKKK